MATIGRKTVPFENLEKPKSDYCGGTGTMANFFKMLTKCKQDIIEQMGTDYSDETVLSFTDFISCVQSGVLCGRSDSFCFICKHYELNSSALAEVWRRERGVEKSPCTFRCQIHNLSNKLFKLFGSDVFDTFYSQDSERLHVATENTSATYRYKCGWQVDHANKYTVGAAIKSDNIVCDNPAVSDVKLWLCEKNVFSYLFKNGKTAVLQAIELIERCKQEEDILENGTSIQSLEEERDKLKM